MDDHDIIRHKSPPHDSRKTPFPIPYRRDATASDVIYAYPHSWDPWTLKLLVRRTYRLFYESEKEKKARSRAPPKFKNGRLVRFGSGRVWRMVLERHWKLKKLRLRKRILERKRKPELKELGNEFDQVCRDHLPGFDGQRYNFEVVVVEIYSKSNVDALKLILERNSHWVNGHNLMVQLHPYTEKERETYLTQQSRNKVFHYPAAK